MGKTLKEIEQKLNEVQEEFREFKRKKRRIPKIGNVIEIAGIQWRILDKLENGYFAITEESIGDMQLDESGNNWQASDLRNYLNTEFLKKIENDIGELLEFKRNLLSLDGQIEYGTCTDKISMLDVDEYRKYRKYLPNLGKWWWLITAWSTPCNRYEYAHAVVSPDGYIGLDNCSFSRGVRPVCIFPSAIFESEE